MTDTACIVQPMRNLACLKPLVIQQSAENTVDSRYLEIEGTLKNTSRYPYFDISDL